MKHTGPMICLWCCTKLALRRGRLVLDGFVSGGQRMKRENFRSTTAFRWNHLAEQNNEIDVPVLEQCWQGDRGGIHWTPVVHVQNAPRKDS